MDPQRRRFDPPLLTMRLTILLSFAIATAGFGAGSAVAQIKVNPTGVNVNAQGATTVFLTFGGLAGYDAAEAFWCGELIPAAPAVGLRCDPATIFGSLPLRYDRSAASGVGGLTDIMTIPPSVSRRAYQAAEAGAGVNTPLILPDEEFRRSLDTFPLEYADIAAAHQRVFGRDPFEAAVINPEDVRRACEKQIKSHILHLREGYIEAHGDPFAISRLVAASAPGFAGLLRSVARLLTCFGDDDGQHRQQRRAHTPPCPRWSTRRFRTRC